MDKNLSNVEFSKLNLIDLKELLNYINNMDFKLRDNLFIDENIKFGIEIEFSDTLYHMVKRNMKYYFGSRFENDNNNCNFNKWRLVHEYSVQKDEGNGYIYGGEINSPILNNSYNSWEDIYKVCQLLNILDGKTNKCGAHIHFDKKHFLSNDVYKNTYKIFLTWYAYEDILYKFGNGEKKHLRFSGYLYAKKLKNIIDPYCLMEVEEDEIFKYIFPIKKKYAIKLSELGTIEVRSPNGTLDATRWQNNINVFANFLEYCISDKNNIEEIKRKILNPEKITLDSILNFSDLIFNNEIDKLYFLKSYFNTTKIDRKTLKKKI